MIKRKIVDPILTFLKQGVTPASLAWAITAGLVIAYIPAFGAATLLCFLAIWLFRLNPAAVLLANQVAYPLQFILFFPFLRTGEWLFGATPVPFTPSEVFAMAKVSIWNVVSLLWQSTLYGIVVWVLISIPVAFLLQLCLRMVFTSMSSRTS